MSRTAALIYVPSTTGHRHVMAAMDERLRAAGFDDVTHIVHGKPGPWMHGLTAAFTDIPSAGGILGSLLPNHAKKCVELRYAMRSGFGAHALNHVFPGWELAWPEPGTHGAADIRPLVRLPAGLEEIEEGGVHGLSSSFEVQKRIQAYHNSLHEGEGREKSIIWSGPDRHVAAPRPNAQVIFTAGGYSTCWERAAAGLFSEPLVHVEGSNFNAQEACPERVILCRDPQIVAETFTKPLLPPSITALLED